MERKLRKIYLTYDNLFIAQRFSPVHFQVLSIIFLKEFIKLNVNMDMIIQVKNEELNIKVASALLNTETLI